MEEPPKDWEEKLLKAIQNEDVVLLRKILSYAVDINKRIGSEQVTFLMLAAGHVVLEDKSKNPDQLHADLVQVILDAKPNVSLEDIDGCTALDYAEFTADKKVIALLKKYGVPHGSRKKRY